MFSIRRAVTALLVVALAGVGSVAIAPGRAAPAAAQSAGFYTPPAPLPAGRDGDVIKSETFTFTGAASATRIMYLSRDNDGRPMPVTGTVLVPTTAWPGGGPRPVVGYAPFTAGMGDQCAVSKTLSGQAGDLTSGVQATFVNAMLAKGIAVAQTDYQGLGTPGDHTYVMRLPEGRAVLDAIRAAQRLPAANLPDAGPVGIAGYSQGGGASGAAAELAPTYAPELNVVGAYAGAPAADLAALATSLDGNFYAGFLVFALLGLDAAYPQIDLTTLANPAGVQLLREANTVCTFDAVFRYAFRQSNTLTLDGRPVRDYLTSEPYRSVVAANRIGTIRPQAPVLVEQSGLDDVLPVAQGQGVARAWCALGGTVQFNDIPTFIPVFVHLLSANTSATNAANWLAGRFSGTPPTTNCGRI